MLDYIYHLFPKFYALNQIRTQSKRGNGCVESMFVYVVIAFRMVFDEFLPRGVRVIDEVNRAAAQGF